MATIERYCAPGVFDPPMDNQAVKVTGAQTILFLAGQVAYEKDGSVACRGDFKGQAREALRAVKALVEAGGGTMDSVVKVNACVTAMRYRADWIPVREGFSGHRLASRPNVVLAPHRGWVTRETFDRFMAVAVDNVLTSLLGQPRSVVNPEVLR